MVVKSNFSEKIFGTNLYGGKIIPDIEDYANNFNNIFVNIGKILKNDKDKQFLVETNDVLDLILKAIKKYTDLPIILSIKEKLNNKASLMKKF